MRSYPRGRSVLAVALAASVAGAACTGDAGGGDGSQEVFNPVTRADSVAVRAVATAGGLAPWQSVRYIGFSFGFEANGSTRVAARHLWDRRDGEYRVEWSLSPDSTIVVLLNVGSREGRAFVNGSQVYDPGLVDQAFTRHINDTYWLLAPFKMLDSGVRREFIADSSTADTDVIRLTFDNVGLTPGDTYWISVDRKTDLVKKWTYFLQGWGDDRSPETYLWRGYGSYEAPAGVVRLASRKDHVSGRRSVLTSDITLPGSVEEDIFTDPKPRLQEPPA